MAKIDFIATHKGEPGETELLTMDADVVPRVDERVCFLDGWASETVTDVTFMAFSNSWRVEVKMSAADAADLATALDA